MVSMIAEPTLANTLETRPEKPIHWAVVLGTATVVALLMWIVGFLAGGLLHQGLMTWLAGPEAVHVLPEDSAELPADARPLASLDGLILCWFLFAAPVGALCAVATEGDEQIRRHSEHVIYVPDAIEPLQPLLSVVPLQLLAYHVAVTRGCNVDKPRNLAKSVTVE